MFVIPLVDILADGRTGANRNKDANRWDWEVILADGRTGANRNNSKLRLAHSLF